MIAPPPPLNLIHAWPALFDGIAHSIYIVDKKYRLAAVNAAGVQLAGLNALAGGVCYQALYRRAEPCPGCHLAETFTTGQSTRRTERRQENASQASEWEISTHPIRAENNRIALVMVFVQDVTEKQQLEASLAQSEKLMAVGQLAAGVAHEINNPLTAIIANAQLLQRALPSDDERLASVDLIARAGDRAQRVVRNLLDFARQEQGAFTTTDVNTSIQSAINLVQHLLFTHSVTLTFDLAPNLPPIQGNLDHLQGVWLNLLLNARDALDGTPGEIRVTTRRQNRDILVTVSDSGTGIAPERLARIFEPFYTTKQPGQGTGLGLSLCQHIIQQHGGQIRVESQVGQGTTFTITLPTA